MSDFDDSKLWETIESLRARVSNLEDALDDRIRNEVNDRESACSDLERKIDDLDHQIRYS